MQDTGALVVGDELLGESLMAKFDAMSNDEQADFLAYIDLILAEKKTNPFVVLATMTQA